MTLEDVRAIVGAAVRAPSVHNTQPWKFVSHQDNPSGPETIDVFADRDRLLGVVDPAGRELHISCGVAIEFAGIRARSLGRACSVVLLPNPATPDHVARIEVGLEGEASGEDLALGEGIASRYTERGRFDDRAVPDELVEELRRLASTAGSWVRVLNQPGDEVVTAVLLAHADALERADPGYEQELGTWLRDDAADVKDGIPSSILPSTPPAGRGSSFRLREFAVTGAGAGAGAESRTSEDEPPPAEHPLVIVLGTSGDDSRSWLEAGCALGRLLARASLDGVFASPMTQVLEMPATRLMLGQQLGLVGHPQILLRLGYGHGHPASPRRPLEEVLTTSE